jgi:aryl-phospho-beta-D-glucosidase BglC (GH1 family)
MCVCTGVRYVSIITELDRVLDLCYKHGIEVILDMHALQGSMNGLDNR